MGRYALYISSFHSELFDGYPYTTSDDAYDLADEAFYWFDEEGWFSAVVDQENNDEIIFRDYYFVGHWVELN